VQVTVWGTGPDAGVQLGWVSPVGLVSRKAIAFIADFAEAVVQVKAVPEAVLARVATA
jgi:hypothetical protein